MKFLSPQHFNLMLFHTGGDSGRVVIWSMEPVKNEAAELDDKIPKMLCQMDNHLGALNNVPM